MVNHFRGRIRYYALWNEQDIGYWNPYGNPEEYGRLLAAFIPAVHETDPQAKVIYTSGYLEDEMVRNDPEQRAAMFLPKPYTPRDLALKVRAALA